MKRFALGILLLSLAGQAEDKTSVFRLHLNTEPTSLSPFVQKTSSSSYLVSQIYLPLLKIEEGQAKPRAAKCFWKNSKRVECDINPSLRWSDGSPLLAEDYARTFRAFVTPDVAAYRVDLLTSLKNAKAILERKKKPDALGVKAQDHKLILFLEKEDPEFLYNLTSPLLTPLKSLEIPSPAQGQEFIVAGPYQIEKWESSKKIRLKPNPFYQLGNPHRPPVEFLFVNEDSVALKLYEKNELSFLRRLPTLYIPKMKDSPEYHTIDQFRFDYIGFSQSLQSVESARAALAESIDYDEFNNLFWSKPRPGCAGLPFAKGEHDVCVSFQPEKAKRSWEQLTKKPELRLLFSKQGGDDHKRGMEWLQSNWKKNLGVTVELENLENKIFLQQLKESAPPLFRKGLAPERPTCLAILENFKKGALENYVHLDSPPFEKIVNKIEHSRREEEKRKWCRQGLEILIHDHWLIPMGPIYFSILAKTEWVGWSLNELNQLDLSQLHHQ